MFLLLKAWKRIKRGREDTALKNHSWKLWRYRGVTAECWKKDVEGISKSDERVSMNPDLFIARLLVFALTVGQSMTLCIPVEHVIHVEKRECAYCLAINTTICEGFCMTWDSNGKKLLPRSALSQEVCTYKDMVYRTVLIPGCQQHAASYYSYPAAVSCKCGKCNTDYSDCVQEASRMGYCAILQKRNSP
ncbi:thyrotropin subunit beta isoform X1 [Heteronotia binoei]|uniref:thyrotropin subunit beta isoform X1 n=2 Tax=Heteronotia binoei TaxID=13085 RepID=UPI00292F5E18|nr:thyrotropin subunit beta isoform X1 [Heteronotia binoei]